MGKVFSRSGEMVDAHGLGPCEATHGGSSPLFGTNLHERYLIANRILFYTKIRRKLFDVKNF